MVLEVLKRTFSLLMLILVIFAASRALIRALPGDPLETLIAESGTTYSAQELRRELNLDQPFAPALVEDLKKAAQGNLGASLLTGKPIAPVLFEHFAKTLELALLTLVFGVALGIASGVGAAARPGSWIDRLCSIHGAMVAALPTPWLAAIFIIVFALWLPIFPVGNHVALPALTLAVNYSGIWARLIRDRMREVLAHGAAPGARARGIPEWKVLLKYGLTPASGALVAYLGTQFGSLLAGAFVTEGIFDWGGMGSLLVEAVLRRDYPVVEAATFAAAAAILVCNTLGDWAQRWMNPKLREEAGA